ncbi:MAG: Tim44 domain-containing protein [Bacilli bacterium]|nr:Tim44 domain-containing protein [Bacilli bacterium]
MKKYKKIFGIIFMCLIVFFAVNLKADSGWDGSYGGGGSSSSSGGSSWSSSSGGSYSSGSDNPIINIIVLIIFVYIIYKSMTKAKTQNKVTTDMKYKISPIKIEVIKEVLPDFDKNQFRQTTFKIYKDIQEAWMEFDYETLKENTTNELYNTYRSELIALKAKKQKNIMKDFELLDFEIVDMEKGIENISLKIRALIKCYDYVIDKNEKVVRGTDKRKVVYNYEMTFTKGLSKNKNKCPNCNAPLEKENTSICPYCNSTVINTNYDWVLSKKQMISQEME